MRSLTFREISFRRVPAPEDFRLLFRQTQKTVHSCEGLIRCAVVGGSTVIGRPTCTSDFDLVVITSADDPTEVVKALSPILKTAKALHIPVDGPTVVTAGEMRRGCHNLTPGYARHLRYAAGQGGLLAGSAEDIMGQPVSNLEDARTYIGRKLKRARESWFSLNGRVSQDQFRMQERSEVLNTWKYAGIRFAQAVTPSLQEPPESWREVLPCQALPVLKDLEEARACHAWAIERQLRCPCQTEWLRELRSLDQLQPTLCSFLSVLERNLPISMPA